MQICSNSRSVVSCQFLYQRIAFHSIRHDIHEGHAEEILLFEEKAFANQAFLEEAAATHLEAAGVAVVVRALGPEPSSVFFTMDVQPVLPFFSSD